MIVIGLTGSIGMGKSTAAAMLQQLGVPVHEADAEVHELLGSEAQARVAVAAAFPYYEHPEIYDKKTKAIKRAALGKIVFSDEKKREALENILHPFVHDAQNKFILKSKKMGQEIVALDIPLLFETGGDEFVDVTIVVSAPFHIQEKRVMERPGMDEKKFHTILERQMPDSEKCERADYVLPTGLGRAETMKDLKKILHEIRSAE
ncbi:MAG: dephospho-CoA kinase [Micavibrio sp.]|nr:MAG: dephospho-CoA kinase [Micavibrio sp.]